MYEFFCYLLHSPLQDSAAAEGEESVTREHSVWGREVVAAVACEGRLADEKMLAR